MTSHTKFVPNEMRNNRVSMNDGIWEEALVVYFKTIYWHLSGDAD